MGLPVNTRRLFLTAAALMCSTTAESRESCGLPTRLPTSSVKHKVAKSCISPCEVWSSYGICLVDPTCFFKSTLVLVQPAHYEYILDLKTLQNPTDIENRLKLIPDVVKQQALKEIDDLFEKIAELYDSGTNYKPKIVQSEDQVSSNSPAMNFDVPGNGNKTACTEPCVVLDEKKCRLNFLCYFKLEIGKLIQQNYPLSDLLDLSSLDQLYRFDHEAMLKELIETLKIEKIQLSTFLVYTYRTFNVMVDINNRNIDLISRLHAPRKTSTVFSLIHRPQKINCFEESLSFLEDTMQMPQINNTRDSDDSPPASEGGVAGGSFGTRRKVDPRSNCPTDCQRRARNNDCVMDLACLGRKFNFNG